MPMNALLSKRLSTSMVSNETENSTRTNDSYSQTKTDQLPNDDLTSFENNDWWNQNETPFNQQEQTWPMQVQHGTLRQEHEPMNEHYYNPYLTPSSTTLINNGNYLVYYPYAAPTFPTVSKNCQYGQSYVTSPNVQDTSQSEYNEAATFCITISPSHDTEETYRSYDDTVDSGETLRGLGLYEYPDDSVASSPEPEDWLQEADSPYSSKRSSMLGKGLILEQSFQIKDIGEDADDDESEDENDDQDANML